MDIIEDSGAVSSPVIDDLVTTNPLPSSPPPITATRNQATITTLVAKPEDATGTYNTIMGEAQSGITTTQDMMKSDARARTQGQDQKSLMGYLADPTVNLSQKQAALNNFKLNPVLSDTSSMLQSNLLERSSAGETPDAEKARISTADALGEMYNSRSQIQSMANALKTKAESQSPFTTFMDHAAGLVPGRNAVQTNKMLDALSQATGVDRSWWKNLSVIVGSGAQTLDARKMISELPYDKQLAVAKVMFQSVQDRGGFLYGNDNMHESYEWFNKLFNNESYGMGGAIMDNITGLLDMAMIGQTGKDVSLMGKNVGRMITGGTGPLNAAEAQMFQKANANVASTVREAPTGTVQGVVNDVTEPGYSAARTVAQDEPQATGAIAQATQRANQAASNVTPVPNVGTILGGSGTSASQVGTKSRAALLGGGRATESIKDTMNRLANQSAVHDINPNSPMEIAQNSNPDSVRSFQEAIVKGVDEAAQAITGVDKQQAIVNSTMPQVSHTGTVFTRTSDVDRNMRVELATDEPFLQTIRDVSVNSLTPAEKANILSRVTHSIGNATGLSTNDAMHSVSMEGNRLMINAVYEAPGGSFSNAEQAMEQAKYALRQYGIQDKDITVLAKQGINHVPVSLEDVRGIEGDYKIQVKASPEVSPSFLDEMENLSVKRNFLDRFAGTHFKDRGSVQRNIVDVASMLDKHITGPASVAKDYGARFENIIKQKANDFAKEFSKLDGLRQQKMEGYIREANFRGIPFDQSDLLSRGFNQSEINTLAKWRSFWDDHHYLENLDVVRSLRNQGYEYFRNANAELYARPIGKVTNVSRFYDPASDSVRGFNSGELDDLYNKGGTLARLRRPASFGGETVEHMIVRQTPQEYTRALTDSDKVLNKLDGYYSISYKSAKFIDEVDADGNKIRTLAVAGDTQEANRFIERMKQTDPSKILRARDDARGFRWNSDEAWDVNSARGRTNQRHRGQLLENADAVNHIGDMTYIASPAEAASRAARSISGRTVMRPMLDIATERFMKQYADYLPKNQWGERMFPQSASQIGRLGETSSSMVGDARTTWEYLNYLRSGYINSVSDGTKAIFNVLANELGEKGYTSLEKAARQVGNTDIVAKAKKTAFMAYLASNPLRQWFMQPAQAWRMVGYNPVGFVNGKVPGMVIDFYKNHAFEGADTDFTKFMKSSGFADAVQHHNLLTSSLQTLADQQNPVSKAMTQGLGTLRKFGFDSGELANMVIHSAAVYDRYKSLGRNVLSRDVQEQMHGEIRALAYDMNAAGDMPYNQGAASSLLQFMQMPHKAWLQYTNRRIDTSSKVQMAIADVLLWGTVVDGAANFLGYDLLPRDNTVANEIVHDGVISTMYNHALNTMFEGTHKADFSSLSPYGLDGWMKLWHSLMGQGVFQTILNSPSGGFFTSRGAAVMKNMASFFAPKEWDDRTTPEKFIDTMTSVADLSSGFSNAHKAYLAQRYGERRDQYGQLIDKDTTTGDSIAQLFGFQSQAHAQQFDLQNQINEQNKSKKQEVLKVYKDIKKFYADHYYQNDNPDFEYMGNVTGQALHYFRNDPEALKIIEHQWKLDSLGPDTALAKSMLKSFGAIDDQANRTRIAQLDVDEQTKKQMNEYLDYAKNAQADITKLTGKE